MSWKQRVPKEITQPVFTGEHSVPYTDLEQMLLKLCHVTSLTEKQRQSLNSTVSVILNDRQEDLDSPNFLYDAVKTYKEFADNKAAVMRNYGASPGKIIATLRNYGHANGWLSYERQHLQTSGSPEMGQDRIGNAGAHQPYIGGTVSGIKTVGD